MFLVRELGGLFGRATFWEILCHAYPCSIHVLYKSFCRCRVLSHSKRILKHIKKFFKLCTIFWSFFLLLWIKIVQVAGTIYLINHVTIIWIFFSLICLPFFQNRVTVYVESSSITYTFHWQLYNHNIFGWE